MSLTTRVLLGLVLGLAIGVFLAPAEMGTPAVIVAWIEPVGALWVNAIRMTVIPLVVSLLLGSITSSEAKAVARVGGRAVAWFIGLVAGTATLGGLAAPPLLQLFRADQVQIPEFATATEAADVTLPPFRDWLVGLLPPNPIEAAAQGAILPLVMFTVIFGVAATRVAPEYREVINRAAKAVSETILVVVDWILATAPIGVFALTLTLAAQTGASVISAVAGFLAVVAILLTTATIALYPLVRAFGGFPMKLFAKACAPAQAVGFSTRSSLASLPPMLEEADRTLGLKPEVSGLVLPAAVSVFKYASPMSRIVGTFFVASLFGVELGAAEIASLAAGMGALSFYSPGIPSGGLFVVAPLWMAFGLPMEGIGILIALDLIPDMILTVANVTGDMAVAAIVGKKSG
ncbi:MAG: dicarboxylate/amino acid:cation symporter [Gemmatimonadetes bacterium]|nr:dicarboxylate/amino acid:cation symporter [Gemmatimonadota bacterium]NNM05161.1 dicarboxylate/amino acid:cation symporter [Gemmatimonadota bacterium]